MDDVDRKLTLKEIDTITQLELAGMKTSDQLTQEETKEFETIIRAEMLHWTYHEYLVYMLQNNDK